jgi:hypothetical protein
MTAIGQQNDYLFENKMTPIGQQNDSTSTRVGSDKVIGWPTPL